MIDRIVADLDIDARSRAVSAHGGIPTMRAALSNHLGLAATGKSAALDILLVAQDANRRGFSAVSGELRDILENGGYHGAIVLAIPDPYIEVWYLADPQSLQTLLGAARALRTPGRGSRGRQYKVELRRVFAESGRDISSGNAEFATEIVSVMNLYRAGRNVPSLGNFINELRSALNQFA